MPVNSDVVRRAAFDFGSGTIRVHVADVHPEQNEVVQTLFFESARLPISEDLATQANGHFSEEIQATALAIAATLKQKAQQFDAMQFSGIATETYRSALNGHTLVKRYLQELAIPVQIISKEDEGKFSFLTVAKERKFERQHLVCCDIGAASFQITYLDENGQLKTYYGPYGRATTLQALVGHLRKEIPSPNPMTFAEWESGMQFIHNNLTPIPTDLLEKVKNPQTVTIAVGGHPPELLSLGVYGTKDLHKFRDHYLNKFDHELTSGHRFFKAANALSDLILSCALLEKLDIESFTYFETIGSSNSTALLLEESLWQQRAIV